MYIHVAEWVMNKQKQPSELKVMVNRKIGIMVLNSGIMWIRRLYSSAVVGRKTWLQEIAALEVEFAPSASDTCRTSLVKRYSNLEPVRC
jgi:hypothetical protein